MTNTGQFCHLRGRSRRRRRSGDRPGPRRHAHDLAEASGRERATSVLERLAPTAPKVCELLEAAAEDLTAFYAFPREHWTKIRSTNPLERVNKEIGRRSDVVGIFPNDAAVIRLAGALLLEQNDEWLVQRRYLSAESMALVLAPEPTPTVEAEEPARLVA